MHLAPHASRPLLAFVLVTGIASTLASLSACSSDDSSTLPDTADASTADGSTTDGSVSCTGTAPECPTGCSATIPGTCVGTTWVCPVLGEPASPCSDAGSDAGEADSGDDEQFTPGAYGGDGVEVTIASDESAAIDFDCASGTMNPLHVSVTGSTGPVFQVAGTIKRSTGVQPLDGGSGAEAATFFGHKNGNVIAFTYTIDGSDAGMSATYAATLGQTAIITHCL